MKCCSINRKSIHSVSKEKIQTNKMVFEDISQNSMIDIEFENIEGSLINMGSEGPEINVEDGESPILTKEISSFLMGKYTVTNFEFKQFINQTKYITDAEKFGWSFVFYNLISEETKGKVTQIVQSAPWWYVVEGASWCNPEGLDSSIENRLNHPVVHVSWNDAIAFCEWAGVQLPTEAEWECAAKGGNERYIYPWGDELYLNNKHQCNIWQGDFPNINTCEDGYNSTAPVDAYEPNEYGLYNMVGNVWEWCSDWFSINDKGKDSLSFDYQFDEVKVMKGGSYLCHDSYCNRYRISARTFNTPDSSSSNVGFRVVKNIKK